MAMQLKTYEPEWLREMLRSQGALSNQSKAYKLVPLIYRALRLRCNSLASVPVRCYKLAKKGGEDVEIDWPFRTSLYDLVWLMEASQLIRGAAFVIPNQGALTGGVRDLQVLNPQRVAVNSTTEPIVFIYDITGQEYDLSTLIYIREYNPDDDWQPGPGAVEVALNDARLLYYLSKFPGAFFESGGMPITLLAIKTVLTDEVNKVVNWFKQRMTGLSNAFGVMGVKADTVTATTITPPLKDMAMPELLKQARQGVADAFELSSAYLDDSANYAVAAQKDQSFWEQVIVPRGKRVESALNAFLKSFGIRLKFCFEELKAFQEDEANRAASLGQLTVAGVPLLMAMEILGYDLSDEHRARLEQAEADKQARAETLAQNLANAQALPPQAEPPAPSPVEEPAQDEQAEELRRWERKALKRLREGKSAAVEFTSGLIPDYLREQITARLAGAATAEEVKTAFALGGSSDPAPALTAELSRFNGILEKYGALLNG